MKKDSLLEKSTLLLLSLFAEAETRKHGTMAERYWQELFSNLETSHYPILPAVAYEPAADRIIEHEIQGIDWAAHNPESLTISTKLRATWALLLAQYANTNDVVFGTRLTGQERKRNSATEAPSAANSEDCVLPIRVQIDWQSSIKIWLQSIQFQVTALEAFK